MAGVSTTGGGAGQSTGPPAGPGTWLDAAQRGDVAAVARAARAGETLPPVTPDDELVEVADAMAARPAATTG